jgi:hypothetical protein
VPYSAKTGAGREELWKRIKQASEQTGSAESLPSDQ